MYYKLTLFEQLTGGMGRYGSSILYFHIVEITGSVLCAIILSSSSPYITIPHSRNTLDDFSKAIYRLSKGRCGQMSLQVASIGRAYHQTVQNPNSYNSPEK